MERVYSFIAESCKKYDIDESHGLKHSIDTVEWARQLIAAETTYMYPAEERMILYCAALHDMCDPKYRNTDEACEEIRTWLITREKWFSENANALVNIITTMSYSKLKLKAQQNNGTPIYPEHGPWQRAYHIARHADLLEGYKVRRCMLYTQHRLPEENPLAYWPIVRELFENRVLNYVRDGWIFLPKAIELAAPLHQKAIADLANEDAAE